MIIVNLTGLFNDISYILDGWSYCKIKGIKGHLPKKERESVVFIVSKEVFDSSERTDTAYADERDLVKDSYGREIGYKQFRGRKGSLYFQPY